MMKKSIFIILLLTLSLSIFADGYQLSSPNEHLLLSLKLEDGRLSYNVLLNGTPMLEDSPLGLVTDRGDFSQDLKLLDKEENTIDEHYTQSRIKQSEVHYQANELVLKLSNAKQQKMNVVFRVSNNDIALRYHLDQNDETSSCIIERELTGFNFPQKTTTFLTPQASPMIGWKRTKPSYEEEYIADDKLGAPSKYGVGFTFPGLFHIGEDGWVLLSETGVSSAYCASKLSEGTPDGLYSVAFPEPEENNGIGNANPRLTLPGATPWRTITVGEDLKPIVETTIPFDVVEPLYESSQDYVFGRSTWSWIMWQDYSMNFDDQMTYVDLAADMGYEYILIDALWDKQVGYEKIPEIIKYAQSQGVDAFVWYNSNGYWNNAPQGPKHKMNTSLARRKEMAWLKSLGVKGLKVDFFGGDKQVTMQLYEDILSDANAYGLMIIFHGCTLPRGWERMYPNYVGSEAVLASENLIFEQKSNDEEAYNASLHPFIRNAVGTMEFGPVLLNKRHNRTNDGGNTRRTSDVFQLATAVLFQSAVQMFSLAPNNLEDAPDFAIDFMKKVPTTWDETVFVDGYPGKYCVLARRHGEQWYVVGINAQKETVDLKVNLPMCAGQSVDLYHDDKDLNSAKESLKINKKGSVKLTIPCNGGLIMVTGRK